MRRVAAGQVDEVDNGALAAVHEPVFDGNVVHEQHRRADREFQPLR